MATTAHTYRFTHDGHEYTRTTKRTYTHAVVFYTNAKLVGREDSTGRIWQDCPPYASGKVAYCSSYALAYKASQIPAGVVSVCGSEIIELAQP
jgi:hypothetical protein